MRILAFIVVFFIASNCLAQLNPDQSQKLDSILTLRNKSGDTSFSLEERFAFVERARRMSEELNIDSTIVESNKAVLSIYFKRKNNNLFKRLGRETLSLATKIRDTTSIAYLNFYFGAYFGRILENDSAYYYYYNAEKIYNSLNDNYNAARVLLNMAIIQKDEKDYIGSESNSIKAIPFLETEIQNKENLDGAYRTLSSVYNNLAIVTKELGNYPEAIEYYNQAISTQRRREEYSKKLEFLYTNNLAKVYEESGNYEKAIEYFSKLLTEKNTMGKDSSFYATVLANYARNKFYLDKEDEELPGLFLSALGVRERIEDKSGIMRGSINLAEYYLVQDSLGIAKMYANKAYDIANKYNRNDDELEVLLLLSKIEKGDEALAYTEKYIALNDSLHKAERAIRNKFARIEFEKDRIEEENVQLSQERELFLILAIAGMISAFLIYIIISQRVKNKELRFSQEQQKANEEIYNLMLTQQDKIEEGRAKEKKRISEDLHDGILGRLFGTRLSLDSLNMSSDKDAVKNRGQYIEELKAIEQEIRRISHDLNVDFVAGSRYLDIVKTLIENQAQAYGFSCAFKHNDQIDWEGVSNKTKIHFYRMIQESLQNIYKHANAKHVDVSFELKGNQIFLSIADDGEGFVVNKAKKGIGLKNIKSRVEELKGELFINSQKDAGTSISISVPI
ncbi:MAG: sensor histidine kinase [Flavobacteriaceae bacterium]|nr:sensor histidine kinase [Flavobacteriaceae bacterium]NNK27253.1 sensor histidine kinase [Flavobacteriaceae bacterium]